jgi:tyrosine aminotransferase
LSNPLLTIFFVFEKSVGVEARSYRLNASKNYEIDLEHLATLVDKQTRFLYVVNPSNPLGTVFSQSHMNEIISFCRSHNLFIISDEVYSSTLFSNTKFTSFGHVN